MIHDKVRKGVIHAHGDKLCTMIGIPPGTKIPMEELNKIFLATLGEKITICGKQVVVSTSMKAIVEILEEKNVLED